MFGANLSVSNAIAPKFAPQGLINDMSGAEKGLVGEAKGMGQSLLNDAKAVFDNNQVAQGIRDLFTKGAAPLPTLAPVPPAAMPAAAGAAPVAPDPVAPAASGVSKGLSEIGGGLLHGAEGGALYGGIVSAVVNGFEVITGKEQLSQAAGGVAADTADGAVSGLTGAAVSGLAIAGASALGLTVGLPLTIIGVVGGVAGAFLGTALFQKTGLYSAIKNGVTSLFGGSTCASNPGQFPVRPVGPEPVPNPRPIPGPISGPIGRPIPAPVGSPVGYPGSYPVSGPVGRPVSGQPGWGNHGGMRYPGYGYPHRAAR